MTVILMLVTTLPTGEGTECQRHLKISPVRPDSGVMKQFMFLKSRFQQFPFGESPLRWEPDAGVPEPTRHQIPGLLDNHQIKIVPRSKLAAGVRQVQWAHIISAPYCRTAMPPVCTAKRNGRRHRDH